MAVDLIPLEFLVIGNGGSIEFFDFDRLRADLRTIVCNGAWEILPIEPDYVVASDEHWVIYNKEHCPYPQMTKEVWGAKHGVPSVPNSHKDSVTGPLACALAWCHSPKHIWCIGFDILTHDSSERYHTHELKRRPITNSKRFEDQFKDVLKRCEFNELQLLPTPAQWEKYLYAK